MKRFILLLIPVTFILTAHAQQFTLVNKGKSKSKIIIPEKPTVIEVHAAMVFQDYIQRISGVNLPIESDTKKTVSSEVLIGNVNRPELKDVPLEKLGKDGLYIKNNGERLRELIRSHTQ